MMAWVWGASQALAAVIPCRHRMVLSGEDGDWNLLQEDMAPTLDSRKVQL